MRKDKTKKFRTAFLLIVLGLFFLHGSLLAADSTRTLDNEEMNSGWKAFIAPFLFANSDDGLILGGGFGLSHEPGLYLISGFEFTTKGNNIVGLEAEWRRTHATIATRMMMGRSKRYIYPASGIDPEFDIESEVEEYEFRFSYLRNYSEKFEMGPTFWYENLRGLNATDKNKNSVDVDNYLELTSCYTVMAGYRARLYSTRSTIRPLDGYILDLKSMGGVSKSKPWKDVKGDFYSEVFFAFAKPIQKNVRTYVRLASSYQPNTPTPLRNYLGGDDRLRGQPDRRDFGNGVIWGRNQIHFTLTRSFDWPQRVAHSIFDFFPTWPLEVELIPFYDYGSTYDKNKGWGRTRHGIGCGLHFILPPELVVRLDLASSPGGDIHYYFSLGQSL